MDYVLVAALALGLGCLLGYGAGVVRTLRFEARRRQAAGASGVLAQLWGEGPPDRDPADIWAGRIPITLGGVRYVLPVAPKRLAEEWFANLDATFVALGTFIEAKELPEAVKALAGHEDTLHDFLIAYAAHVGVELPARGSELDYATSPEILRSTVEVWVAHHPLAVALAQSEASPTPGPSAASTTSSLVSTVGDATTSTVSSPTSSSSPTSTPRRSASKPDNGPSSAAGSKPSGSGPSSPTTSASTGGGRRRPAPRASAVSPAQPSSRP